jgi:hypothetical protein
MTHKKQTLSALDAEGLSRSVCTIRKVQFHFTEKHWFTLAARAALIGCELHIEHLGQVTLFRLQCLQGTTVMSHPHDVQAAITARGAA